MANHNRAPERCPRAAYCGKISALRRGGSSAGRASRSQCEGRGFDPLPLHHRKRAARGGPCRLHRNGAYYWLEPAEPALLVPTPGALGFFESVLSEVPGPLWSGSFVTEPEGAVVLPPLELCSRWQRVFAAPVSVSQSVVTVEPVVAPEVALPGPALAAPASRGVSWLLAWPKDAVERPNSAAATAAPSNFMFINFLLKGLKKDSIRTCSKGRAAPGYAGWL